MRNVLRATLPAIVVATVAVAAHAHSEKRMTTPENGAVLSAAPAEVRMMFDKPILITMFVLTDADGTEYRVERRDGMVEVREFVATPPVLPAGDYGIEWRGLSFDGHPMRGTLSFTVE